MQELLDAFRGNGGELPVTVELPPAKRYTAAIQPTKIDFKDPSLLEDFIMLHGID
jgi:ribosomal protein S18